MSSPTESGMNPDHHMSGNSDYWKEFCDIKQSKSGVVTEDSEDDLSKTPDEGELEATWLTTIGLGHFVSRIAEGGELNTDEDIDVMLSILTKQQRATVQRRMDTLTATWGRRKQASKTDVRDIFPVNDIAHANQNHILRPHSPLYGYGSNVHGFRGSTSTISDPNDYPSSRRSDNKYRHFYKKGLYAMDGDPNAFESSNGCGIEMLSINPMHTWNKWAGNNIIGKVTTLPNISEQESEMWFIEDRSENGSSNNELPNFCLEHREEGYTKLSDLSKSDMSRLRCLAVIEVSMLFDHYNIPDTSRKGKKPSRDHGIFGVPLQVQLENDQRKYPFLEVPLFFKLLIEFLMDYGVHVEGILRVPGSAGRIKNLRTDLEEQFYQGRFDWKSMSSNDAAALMKQFLRDLPNPLLTHEYRESFAQVQFISNLRDQLKALNLLIMALPDAHINSLELLLRFLKKVVDYKNENKMSLSNVAMIMAPNLFLPSSSKKLKNFKDWELSIAVPANIVKLMVKYIDILWTVPPSMIQQMRRRYELEMTRKSRRLKILGRKDRQDILKKSANSYEPHDSQENVIHVQAPHLSKAAMKIHLVNKMTVADILARFQGVEYCSAENGSDQNLKGLSNRSPNHIYLYEVGGNIGERRLDPNAMMSTIHRINPHAEWIVKTR